MSALTLVIQCPDQKGIIAEVTQFIYRHKGNILYIDQYVDRENKAFFMRLESEFNGDLKAIEQFQQAFADGPASKYNMTWSLYPQEKKPRMALFVSKYDHCLYDLLGRFKSGELEVDIPFILSNHPDLEPIAASFDIPYYHIPVTKDTKAQAEEQQLTLLKQHRVSFIVLARYMQIVSPKLIDEYPNNIINIHHSFLPSFKGARPYNQAFLQGVKIIGATAHYVTEKLDEGQIIEQDVARVDHTKTLENFISIGRDIENLVLKNAINWHLERRVIINENRTIVFN